MLSTQMHEYIDSNIMVGAPFYNAPLWNKLQVGEPIVAVGSYSIEGIVKQGTNHDITILTTFK